MTNEPYSDHYKKYDKLSKVIGIETLKRIMPATPEAIKQAFQEDEYLNSISLDRWDRAATTLTNFYNVASLSLAEKVCILKHVAQYYYATI